MSGISVHLPLSLDEDDGLKLNKNLHTSTRQNLINLILTCPGERPMNSNFGVGLRNFLFELDNFQTKSEIAGKIQEQVSLFLPFVEIDKISFFPEEIGTDNSITITIFYTITPLAFTSEITFSNDENDFFVIEQELENDDLSI